MLLALIVWLGGVIFFPVVAQTAFSVLPTRQLAGSVVGRSLGILHWMGMISGVVFLVSSRCSRCYRSISHSTRVRASHIRRRNVAGIFTLTRVASMRL